MLEFLGLWKMDDVTEHFQSLFCS